MATERRFGETAVENPVTVGRVLVPFVMLGLWELGSLLLGSGVLPGPVETVLTIQRGIEGGWLLGNFVDTMWALVVAYVLAVTCGLVVGLVLGLNDTANDVFEIYVLGIYAIPLVVMYPIFLFLFGLDVRTKIAFAFVHGFFPMVVVSMSAIRDVDEVYLQVARSLRLGQWKRFRYIVLPSILVQLVIALRLAFNLTFIGVILAELFASASGLGLVLQHAMELYHVDRIMAIVTVLVVFALAINLAFYAAQQLLERRWNMDVETETVGM